MQQPFGISGIAHTVSAMKKRKRNQVQEHRWIDTVADVDELKKGEIERAEKEE